MNMELPRLHSIRSRCAVWRVCTALAFALLPADSLFAQRTVLVGAMLFDGNSAVASSRSRIVIEGGRFTCVSGPDGCAPAAGDREIDLTGKWISPGLIDTHVHLPFAIAPDGLWRQQRLRFALGITTVRDAGSLSTDTLLAARQTAESATEAMPRLVIAARVIADDTARLGVGMGAPMVGKLAAMGVDAIKIKEPFVNEDWRKQIRAARAAGIPAFGHTWASVREVFTRAAVAEGISGVSHIMEIPLETQPVGTVLTPPDSSRDFWPWEKRLWLTMDSARVDSLLSEMVAANVWLEPTLATEYHFGRPLEAPQAAGFLRHPPSLRALASGTASRDAVVYAAYPATWERQSAFVGDFIRRGGMVVAGADGKAPGIDLHEEMRLIGVAANSAIVGLQAATRNAAIALNRRDLGTIEPGKLADAVVYHGDPLAVAYATLDIARVIKGGVSYDADSLRVEFQAEYDAKAREVWRGRASRALIPFAGTLAVLALGLAWRRRRAQ